MQLENINYCTQRYRTIKECLVEIKKIDRDTAITEWFIRQLCNTNKITYFKSGNKSLVNLDSLLSYLGFINTQNLQKIINIKGDNYYEQF